MKLSNLLFLFLLPFLAQGQDESAWSEIGLIHSFDFLKKNYSHSDDRNYLQSTAMGLEYSLGSKRYGLSLAVLYAESKPQLVYVDFGSPAVLSSLHPEYISFEFPITAKYYLLKPKRDFRIYTGCGLSIHNWIAKKRFRGNFTGNATTIRTSGNLGFNFLLFQDLILERRYLSVFIKAIHKLRRICNDTE